MPRETFRRAASLAFLAFLGYALVAALFVWPLPLLLSNHITGDPAGDAGAYVWNAYVFSHNLAEGSSVFKTDRILTLAHEASLALHNNSLLLSAVAAPLIPVLGVIASFNSALIVILVLNPLCAYLLAKRETGAFGPSWIAGALFGFSPFINARVEGHMSLATAFALPLVVLFAREAVQRPNVARWALVALALALCASSDPYYVIFGLITTGIVWIYEQVTLARVVPTPRVWLTASAALLLAISIFAIVWIAVTGGGTLQLGPIKVGVRDPHTPVLLLTLAGLLFLVRYRPRSVVVRPGAIAALKAPLLACLFAGLLLSPWLRVAAAEVFARGGTSAPLWRSSPPGVDLLSFVLPNPTHPLIRPFIEPWMARERPDAFVEGVASWTVSGLIVLAVLIRFRAAVIPRFWIWFTAMFAALSLGPFVVAFGVQTYVPGPWALLRFVPGIGMVRAPTRFAVLATLGLAMVMAHALTTAKLGRRRTLALVALGGFLGLELIAPHRRMFAAALPEMYQVMAEDRCDVVILRLPTGIVDGTGQRGKFSSETQFRQVFHGKRLLGGYVSRLSPETVALYEGHPTVHALLDLSEGKAISAEARRAAIKGARGLATEIGIGFIALNKEETSQDLRDFVQEAFEPRPIHKAWPFVISIPFGEHCTNGECGHLPGCPHRTWNVAAPRGAASR